MPKSDKAKEIMQDFKDQYGEEEGERIYYSTAKAQGRDPDSFKKESIIKQDIYLEDGDQIKVIPKGMRIVEEDTNDED